MKWLSLPQTLSLNLLARQAASSWTWFRSQEEQPFQFSLLPYPLEYFSESDINNISIRLWRQHSLKLNKSASPKAYTGHWVHSEVIIQLIWHLARRRSTKLKVSLDHISSYLAGLQVLLCACVYKMPAENLA